MLKFNKITDKELVKVEGQDDGYCKIGTYYSAYDCYHDCHTKNQSSAYKSYAH